MICIYSLGTYSVIYKGLLADITLILPRLKLAKEKKNLHETLSIQFVVSVPITVFENHRKSLIQQCERSELRLHFEWTKVN